MADTSGGRKGSRQTGGGSRTVRSVERAGRVMQALLLAGPEGKRVSDLSTELGLHKTTVVRLLHTLVAMGGARKDDATDRYCWDPMTWVVLVGQLREPMAVQEALQQVLRRLVEVTGWTAVVGRPDLGRRNLRLVAYARADHAMQVDPGMIRSVPVHAVAGGKAYLAAVGEEELEEWLRGGLRRMTQYTTTSADDLRKEIKRIREQGYATSRGELFVGAASVGVAVRDEGGTAVGSLDVVGPAEDVTGSSIARAVPLLGEAAEKISGVVYGDLAEGLFQLEATGKGETAGEEEGEGEKRYRVV